MLMRKFKISSHFLDHDMLHKSEGVSYDNEGTRSYDLLEIISKKIHEAIPKKLRYGTKRYKNLEAKEKDISDYKDYVKWLNKFYKKPFSWIMVTKEEYDVWYKYWLEYYYDSSSYFGDIRSQYNSHDPMIGDIEKPKWLPKKRTPSWEYTEAKNLLYRMEKFFGKSNFCEDHRAGKKINFAVTMVNEMGPEKALEVAKGLKEKKIIN